MGFSEKDKKNEPKGGRVEERKKPGFTFTIELFRGLDSRALRNFSFQRITAKE